jgi:DNA invertase Pin-like site-specific DNA recombinase
MYAKDISTKIKSTLHTKARRGEYLGALDPYGYLRHPDDKHKLIINEETAPVVRRMFEMCAAGIGANLRGRRYMKKRLFSLVLAFALCLGLTVPAFAAKVTALK